MIKNSFTRGQLFFGLARTVGIVYGYTVFSDRAKLELQSETDICGPTNW